MLLQGTLGTVDTVRQLWEGLGLHMPQTVTGNAWDPSEQGPWGQQPVLLSEATTSALGQHGLLQAVDIPLGPAASLFMDALVYVME